MNIFGVIILATILIKFSIETIARLLNAKSTDPRAPVEFQDLYDPAAYARAQDYGKVTTRFHLVESTIHLILFLAFWFLGGFPWIDEIARSFGFGPIVTGILFVGILGFFNAVISLPFSIYATFVIEEKFGFNRTTVKTFILDRIKALILMLVLGVPFLAAILWFFDTAGDRAVLYAWLFTTLFFLVVQFVTPIWIMPLFNKFTPIPDGELRAAIAAYAASVGFAFKEVFTVDASKRSSKANAFFTGFGKNKRIGLFDNLVEQQTVSEIVAVLAHEVGHYQKKHVPLFLVVSIVHSLVVFYLLSIFLKSQGLYEAFHMQPSTYAGLLLFGLLYEPISFLLSIVLHAVSRRNELQADRYAVDTLGEGENLISSLKKLSVKNMSNLSPHPLYVFLSYTHPPLMERIKKMRAYARSVATSASQ